MVGGNRRQSTHLIKPLSWSHPLGTRSAPHLLPNRVRNREATQIPGKPTLFNTDQAYVQPGGLLGHVSLGLSHILRVARFPGSGWRAPGAWGSLSFSTQVWSRASLVAPVLGRLEGNKEEIENEVQAGKPGIERLTRENTVAGRCLWRKQDRFLRGCSYLDLSGTQGFFM